MRRPLILFSLFAAAACTAKPAGTTDSAAMADTSPAAGAQSTDDAKAAIGKVRDAWKAGADKKDAAAVAALYTDDAEMVGTESPVAKGRDAIQKDLAASFPISKIESIDSHDLQVSGDVAYDYGEFTQDVTPPKGKAMTIHGYYLVVLRKQADGSWKLVRHVSTTPPKT